MFDLDTVTHVCPCGSEWWSVVAKFVDYEVAAYRLRMVCVSCGSTALAPTGADRPEALPNGSE